MNKTSLVLLGGSVVALMALILAAYVAFVASPSPTTFNVTVDTERITYTTVGEPPSRIVLDSVEVFSETFAESAGSLSPFIGSFQVGPSAKVEIQRIGLGGLSIIVEAYETGSAGRFFDEAGEPAGEAGSFVEFYVDDPSSRALEGQSAIIPLAGEVFPGRKVGIETRGTTAILRSGKVTMIGRSIFWGLNDKIFEAGSVNLDMGDQFFVDTPQSEAFGFAVVNERPAMTAAYRVVGRRAHVVRPGPNASSSSKVAGYPVSISFLDRLLHDPIFQVLSLFFGGLVALTTIGSFVVKWLTYRGRSFLRQDSQAVGSTKKMPIQMASQGQMGSSHLPDSSKVVDLAKPVGAPEPSDLVDSDDPLESDGFTAPSASDDDMPTSPRQTDPPLALLILLFLLFGVNFVPVPTVAQDPVFVRAGDEEARGVLRARQNECFAVLPLHFVERVGAITLVDHNGSKWEIANKQKDIFEPDLAVLRVPELRDCDLWPAFDGFDETISNYLSGFLEIRSADGTSTLMPVSFRRQDAETVSVKPSDPDDELRKMMSGSSLFISRDGKKSFAGLLMWLDGEEQSVGTVYQADDLTRSINSFFPRTAPELDAATAQTMLDRAIDKRDGAMQGQVGAVESLIAHGHSFENVDLSGISLAGADLRGGTFDGASMDALDLSEVEGRDSRMVRGDLRFARLERGKFQKATFSQTYAPFVWGEAAVFDGADLAGATFFGGDLRKTSFRGANLRGAALAFADLRGATFDGADLTGAYLTGSVLDGATFENATIRNTEFAGAAANGINLTESQQRGACRHEARLEDDIDGGLDWWVELIEHWKSDQSSIGAKYERVMNSRGLLQGFSEMALPPCSSETDVPPYYDAQYPATMRIHLARGYLGKARRRSAFQQRVQNQLDFLEDNLGPDRILRDQGLIEARRNEVVSIFENARLSCPRFLYQGEC
jgi:uncharacterized protein YjbI with pentapeptide repeats